MIRAKVDSAEALAGLKLLQDELKVKAVAAGLRRPGSAVATSMRNLVPNRTGRLRGSISARALSRSGAGRLGLDLSNFGTAVLIGPNKKVDGKGIRYFAILEGGTKPHMIKAKSLDKEGQAFLSFGKPEGATGAIRHPGIKARPFLQRSLDSVGSARIEELFYVGLAAHLDKLARK